MNSAANVCLFKLPRLMKIAVQKHHVMQNAFSYCSRMKTRCFHTTMPFPDEEKITVKFQWDDGKTVDAVAKVGEKLLDVVINNDIEIGGYGACEGTLACSTCHLILENDVYNETSKDVATEETDMLDLAFGVTDTSRLGCQLYVTKQLDGKIFKVPGSINDMRS